MILVEIAIGESKNSHSECAHDPHKEDNPAEFGNGFAFERVKKRKEEERGNEYRTEIIVKLIYLPQHASRSIDEERVEVIDDRVGLFGGIACPHDYGFRLS